MNLRQLVGKKVIRTKPFMNKDLIQVESPMLFESKSSDEVVELPDYSFCDCHITMIEVLKVVQNTPIVKVRVRKGGASQGFDDGYIRAISGEYDDNNWKDVTEVYSYMDKVETKIREEKESRIIKKMRGFTSGHLYPMPPLIEPTRQSSDMMFSSILHNMLDFSNIRFCEDIKENTDGITVVLPFVED